MATIEKKGNGWYGQFLYRGRRRYFAIGKVTEAEAEAWAKADQVGYLVMRLNQGLIQLPPGVDFVKRDGAAPKATPAARIMLQALQDRYLETHESSLEPHTLRGVRRHFKHLAAHLGPGHSIASLTLADLQG